MEIEIHLKINKMLGDVKVDKSYYDSFEMMKIVKGMSLLDLLTEMGFKYDETITIVNGKSVNIEYIFNNEDSVYILPLLVGG